MDKVYTVLAPHPYQPDSQDMNFECTVWKINIFPSSLNVEEQFVLIISFGVPRHGRLMNSDEPVETCSTLNAASPSLYIVESIPTYV